jgi:hypothetical protein
VKISGTIVEDNRVEAGSNHSTIAQKTVTILAENGAALTPATDGDLLVIDDSNVSIYNLTFQEVRDPSHDFFNPKAAISVAGDHPAVTLVDIKIRDSAGVGINFSPGSANGSLTVINSTISNNRPAFYAGIFAAGSPDDPSTMRSITVTHCTIENNPGSAIYLNNADIALQLTRSTLDLNADGGVLILRRDKENFAIVGNVIANNGSKITADTSGGILIETFAKPSSASRVEFNTIVGNQSNGNTAGIDCGQNFMFVTRNNIVFDNEEASSGTQISSNCSATTSLIDIDPLFIANDFPHLQMTSLARGAGDPASLADPRFQCDIDNDQRTNPPDIGADQARFAPGISARSASRGQR